MYQFSFQNQPNRKMSVTFIVFFYFEEKKRFSSTIGYTMLHIYLLNDFFESKLGKNKKEERFNRSDVSKVKKRRKICIQIHYYHFLFYYIFHPFFVLKA